MALLHTTDYYKANTVQLQVSREKVKTNCHSPTMPKYQTNESNFGPAPSRPCPRHVSPHPLDFVMEVSRGKEKTNCHTPTMPKYQINECNFSPAPSRPHTQHVLPHPLGLVMEVHGPPWLIHVGKVKHVVGGLDGALLKLLSLVWYSDIFLFLWVCVPRQDRLSSCQTFLCKSLEIGMGTWSGTQHFLSPVFEKSKNKYNPQQ